MRRPNIFVLMPVVFLLLALIVNVIATQAHGATAPCNTPRSSSMLTYRTLRIESAPLHTETKAGADQAPAQVTAVLKRLPHVATFTEVHSTLSKELALLAAHFGYDWIHGSGDTAIAVKSSLKATHAEVQVPGTTRYLLSVCFDFKGHKTTVFAMHWATLGSKNAPMVRAAQTDTLVHAMDKASQGTDIAFCAGDSNPGGPLKDPSSQPRATLNKAGLVLIYQELNQWPDTIGVNLIARPSKDARVKAARIVLHDALGSDHVPVTASYRVR